MFDAITDEVMVAVRAAVAANLNIALNALADNLGIPEGAAVLSLEDSMCRAVPAGSFANIWKAMTGWEQVTFIVHSPGAITEVRGKLPEGNFGHGFFNFGGENGPLSGHIRTEEIGVICMVSKPFMGMERHSVRFYNKIGALMFAVYAGRDENGLLASVRESFMQLRESAGKGTV
jgi:putative heme utilization carrier protein HutX